MTSHINTRGDNGYDTERNNIREKEVGRWKLARRNSRVKKKSVNEEERVKKKEGKTITEMEYVSRRKNGLYKPNDWQESKGIITHRLREL